ncbi:MAG: Hsp70 family protein [Polyangiaceae bacterium]|nr:Hsp70 family protein [Polyangiaceae bacterium]
MARIVGIDLGTTNSLVAFMDGDRPRIIPSRTGARMTPSVVGLDHTDRVLVGSAARSQLATSPGKTVAEVKRLMGSAERVALGERLYTPTEISALVLKALKDDAERFFGETVDEAVVTVPAYFTDAQRQATKDAGHLAGLQVDRILNEPTAAALAYGLDHLDKEQTVVVYDLGGGTFDVSVLEMFDGVLEVKASAGNNKLGGGDFDRALAEHIAKEIARRHGIDVRSDPRAFARVLLAAEEAKRQLSATDAVPISLPGIGGSSGLPISYEGEISRAGFEALVGDMIRSTLEPVKAALTDARLSPRQVSEIVLVGGSSRVPLVHRAVAEFFGKEPLRGVDPDEAVALGAAVQAGLKVGSISTQTGIMITDVCPFTLGVEVAERAGQQLVTGIFSPVIPRNSTVPISRTDIYSTTGDGQREVEVRVFQGDARYVRNNVFLGQYRVEGIPAGPKGSQRVSITFSYDINGILQVTTKVLSTGKETSLRIDKTPERMTVEERATAAARIDREWKMGAPVEPAKVHNPGVENDLLTIAKKRLAELPSHKTGELSAVVGTFEEALKTGDKAAAARHEARLTDLLFELE